MIKPYIGFFYLETKYGWRMAEADCSFPSIDSGEDWAYEMEENGLACSVWQNLERHDGGITYRLIYQT